LHQILAEIQILVEIQIRAVIQSLTEIQIPVETNILGELQVEEACLECSDAQRDEFLYYILAQHPGRTLVFVNAISAVRRVAALLKLLGLPAVALHASMQQRQRLKALDRFKADPTGVLVATDVAARGLDITVGVVTVHTPIQLLMHSKLLRI
jgi:superfamily II DNA/RNA helicase